MTPFITFEGIDNSGKTTQIKRIAQWLKEKHIDVVTTREPGGSQQAEHLRQLLVTAEQRWLPVSELLLFYAARAEHLYHKIKPALAQGRWVLCDRFIDSSYAYQGDGYGVDKKLILLLEKEIVQGTQPQCTFIFDMPIHYVREREKKHEHQTHYEKKDDAFLQRVRAALLERARHDKKRCLVIDASQSIDVITAQLQKRIEKAFSL